MTFPEFDRFQEKLLEEVVGMCKTKGIEYANSESNRFANFDRLSERLKIPNTQIGLIYLTKHLDSIESFVIKKKVYSNETIRGRIVDAITYLTLIGGMIEEAVIKDDEESTAALGELFEGTIVDGQFSGHAWNCMAVKIMGSDCNCK